MLANKTLTDKQLLIFQVVISLVFCSIPLFVTFPYKINLYLAWEGAYRISEGQIPFRDFGMPLGYGFWIIPALFFKIFGPFMSSLIKAQVFLNLLSIIALNAIWRSLGTSQVVRTIGTAIFCFTYVFIHFWPWYNHTVYVFEWISIAFLLVSFKSDHLKKIIFAGLAGVFAFLSLFTKQDIGALGIFLSLALIIGDFYFRKDYRPGLTYLTSAFIFGFLMIWPLTNYDFGYWYNYGQEPHSTRISAFDYLDELFSERTLLYRIYFLALVIMAVSLVRSQLQERQRYDYTMLFLLALGGMVQSLLAGVTSYVPMNSHFYYHTIFFIFALKFVDERVFRLSGRITVPALILLIFFTWSQDPWKYSKRLLSRVIPQNAKDINSVNRHTYIIKPDSITGDRSKWVKMPYRSLDNITVPAESRDGFEWVMNKYSGIDGLSLLNMSEFPQLYYELDVLPAGSEEKPLWFHRNVAFFDREVSSYCSEIEAGKYDVILFEVIPNLNGFYPDDVRACIQDNYTLVHKFKAPRVQEFSTIEVYERSN